MIVFKMTRNTLISLFLVGSVLGEVPRGALPLDAAEWPANYRLHLEGAGTVVFSDEVKIELNGSKVQDVAVEHPVGGSPVLRVWSGAELVRGPEEVAGLARSVAKDFPDSELDLGGDFTAMVSFVAHGDGTLFSKSDAGGEWSEGAKALFIRDGKLTYDIGMLGAISGGPVVNDGKHRTAVVSVRDGEVRLWLDGLVVAERKVFSSADGEGHVFKVGRAWRDFGGDFSSGSIDVVRVWKRALPEGEMALLFKDGRVGANTPDFSYLGEAGGKAVVEGLKGWVQALERSDHGKIVSGWDEKAFAEGREIYAMSCVICHGNMENPGSLPTATRFHEGEMKNGADPYSMYLTLTHGYNQMVAQPQFTTAQKYAVIHYIRESFLSPHNKSQYTEVTPAYIETLPKGLAMVEEEQEDRSLPPYLLMDMGPALFWTYELTPDNIAQKGIAVRLDDGPGGVSKGKAWMIYDHDTMRVATATTGDFVDWKGIAFDGSHRSHTSLSGDMHFVNPVGPGWGVDGFEDTRAPAKDGVRYGPHEGLRLEGLYSYGDRVVVAANIFGTRVLESPAWIEDGDRQVFVRTINVGGSEQALLLRVAPDEVNVVLQGRGSLSKEGGFWVATLPAESSSRIFISRSEVGVIEGMADGYDAPFDLSALTKGGPARWLQTVTTTSIPGAEGGAFIMDDFPLPIDNPWDSWMRPGGFDFTPDGKSAVVAMWNGDVWRVDGISEKAPATLTWRRIVGGLFQPLGVKFRGDDLFVTCRDQIARLRDLNGNGEIDLIECFNSDSEVTEHFHEFAMGLQVDDEGNFYYAKSGRHAKDSLVPQHGTLLRVSADGSKTDILATGFRAANGVCLNDDGTFFVTDQEGFWTPKNRINLVREGGFYGNMYGYTEVTDTSDEAMEQPVVWVTNEMDRSPAELVWIPKDAWGTLGGGLLNLSYGTGRAYIVPYEEVNGMWQGAVSELPMEASPTGIMRGRFGADGELYTCGMYAWAGNALQSGGFHRIRRSGEPAQVPMAVEARKGRISVTFSEAVEAGECSIKVWSLVRSERYGSDHHDERELEISEVKTSSDGKTVILEIPGLAPTYCYELKVAGRVLHGTIHYLE